VPRPPARLAVSGFPNLATAGTVGRFSVTALDASWNTALGYTGTVHLTSSDSGAVLPGDYTFVSGDNGTHSFSATLKTVGPESITATDKATISIRGTQSVSVVNPPPPVITSSTSDSGYVGQAISYQIAGSNTPTSYDATGLPAWWSVNKSTGAISGIPTTGGTVSVTISATNAGGTGSAPLTISVNPAPDEVLDVFVWVTLRKCVHIAWATARRARPRET